MNYYKFTYWDNNKIITKTIPSSDIVDVLHKFKEFKLPTWGIIKIELLEVKA